MGMQKLTLKCADARHLVHLAVGDDTLADEEQGLAEHLHECSDCRAYHAGMLDAMQQLELLRDEPDDCGIPSGAVWSGISSRVRSRALPTFAPGRRRFNGAVAALCACSLTLALVTIIQKLPTNSQDPVAVYPTMEAFNASSSGSSGTRQPPSAGPVPVKTADGRLFWLSPVNSRQPYPDVFRTLPDVEGVNF